MNSEASFSTHFMSDSSQHWMPLACSNQNASNQEVVNGQAVCYLSGGYDTTAPSPTDWGQFVFQRWSNLTSNPVSIPLPISV